MQKPFEIEEMEVKIEKALEMRRMQHQIDYLRHAQGDIYDFDRIIGSSGALEKVLGVVRKVAKSNTTVLVRGETGTGKELIAGAIHHNSHRAARNFIKVNCAALQENLLESELFGHEKGAFTGADKQRIGRFEQADGGTLFLDEIGDMSANTQAKILRVLQEHEFERLGGTRTIKVDVRLIAATNRDLTDDGGIRAVPRRPLLPPQRRHHRDAAAARAQGRHRARSPGFFIRRFSGELKKKIEGLGAGRAEAADALPLAGQHPRARERDRARDAAGRRHAHRRRRPAARRHGDASARRARRRRSSRSRRPASRSRKSSGWR